MLNDENEKKFSHRDHWQAKATRIARECAKMELMKETCKPFNGEYRYQTAADRLGEAIVHGKEISHWMSVYARSKQDSHLKRIETLMKFYERDRARGLEAHTYAFAKHDYVLIKTRGRENIVARNSGVKNAAS